MLDITDWYLSSCYRLHNVCSVFVSNEKNYIYLYLFISLLFIFISIFTSINIFVNRVLIDSGYTTAFT